MRVPVTILASCFLLLVFSIPFLPSKAFALKQESRQYDEIEIPGKIAECVTLLGPGISTLHAKALEYARITPNDISSWKKNIKLSALLPRLQFGYERRLTDGVSVAVDDKVSVTGAGSVIGPSTSAIDQNLDRNHNIEINAIWYLDELLFNRDSLSISSEARSQVSARQNLLSMITDDYFELKRLISIYELRGPEMDKIKGRIRLQIDYLIGKLDAVSGGWFGQNFKWKESGCESK